MSGSWAGESVQRIAQGCRVEIERVYRDVADPAERASCIDGLITSALAHALRIERIQKRVGDQG